MNEVTKMLRMIAILSLLSVGAVSAREMAADSLDSFSILALGALDGRAVIKTPDNKMHVLKLGSVIPGTKATVTQILADKLVVEDAVDSNGASLSQTVWITKGGADGKVIVQRMSMEAPPAQIATHASLVFTAVEPDASKKPKKKKGDK